MNTHKNARLTFLRRLELVQDITERGLSVSEAAAQQGVSAVTARKWLGRYLAKGADGLLDKSSRPARSPRQIAPDVALVIVELRRKVMLQAQIASYMGVSKATVSRVLRRAGLSRLSDLRPPEPVQRYERGEDIGTAASMCKLYCTEMVGRVADRAVQVHGGMGLVRGFPVERFYRDVRHYRVGEGTSEILRMLIARDLFRGCEASHS